MFEIFKKVKIVSIYGVDSWLMSKSLDKRTGKLKFRIKIHFFHFRRFFFLTNSF